MAPRERHLKVVVGDALEDAEVDARRAELVGAEGVLVKRLELERLLEEVALDAGELEVPVPLGLSDVDHLRLLLLAAELELDVRVGEPVAVLRRQADGAQQVDVQRPRRERASPSRPTRPRT